MKKALIIIGTVAAVAITATLWCCIRINHKED